MKFGDIKSNTRKKQVNIVSAYHIHLRACYVFYSKPMKKENEEMNKDIIFRWHTIHAIHSILCGHSASNKRIIWLDTWTKKNALLFYITSTPPTPSPSSLINLQRCAVTMMINMMILLTMIAMMEILSNTKEDRELRNNIFHTNSI